MPANGATPRRRVHSSRKPWSSGRELGDRVAVARCLSNLANAVQVERDYALARSLHEEALSLFRELGDQTGVAWAINHEGDVASEQGNATEARALYEKSLALFRALGDEWGIAGTLADMGNLACEKADYRAARSLYQESMTIFQRLGHKRGVARLLECFASAAAAERKPERALRLAGTAAALREALGAPLSRAEQDRLGRSLEAARETLGDRDSAAIWMEGWAMPLEKAVESALEPADCRERTDGRHSPVVGSMSWRTAEMRLAGKPPLSRARG